MTDLHRLRVEGGSQKEIEAVGPEFHRDKLLWARDQSWKVLEDIRTQLELGMTERDAFHLARKVLEGHGVKKHWHKPFVRFGPGTLLTFHDPLKDEYKLCENSVVYIDLGPVWRDENSGLEYEGDVGDSFVFGKDLEGEKICRTAKELFLEAEEQWHLKEISGAHLYEFLASRSKECGYLLTSQVDGHRLSDFPHKRYSRRSLSSIAFQPLPFLWVLEVHIRHKEHPFGAFYEDMLGVRNNAHR